MVDVLNFTSLAGLFVPMLHKIVNHVSSGDGSLHFTQKQVALGSNDKVKCSLCVNVEVDTFQLQQTNQGQAPFVG